MLITRNEKLSDVLSENEINEHWMASAEALTPKIQAPQEIPPTPEMTCPGRKILYALKMIKRELTHIPKNQQGHNYKFRGIDQVLNALDPLFSKYAVIPSRRNVVTERIVRDVVDKFGKPKQFVETFIKSCDYVFTCCDDGSEFITQGFGEGQDSAGGDKSASMATSNSFKYVIFEMFTIAVAEQKDSDQFTAEQEAKAEHEFQMAKAKQGNKQLPPKGPSQPVTPPSQAERTPQEKVLGELRYLTKNYEDRVRLKILLTEIKVASIDEIKAEKDINKLKGYFEYLRVID